MKKVLKIFKEYKRYSLLMIVLLVFIVGVWYFHGEKKVEEKSIRAREPAVAGAFYPGNAEELSMMVESFLNTPEDKKISHLKALIVPHAGYIYSGQTAGYGFKQLEGKNYETVILIGASHQVFVNGFTIDDVTHYKTPLGLVELSPKVEELRKEDYYNYVEAPKEHSLEVELPFLQKTLKDFKIIPVLTGNTDPMILAAVLRKYVDDKTLIVVSTDLSHYHTYEEAKELDNKCTDSIPALEISKTAAECEACGKIPILTLMLIAKDLGWKGELLDYRNSGDTAGDKSKVVGYSSIAFYEEIIREEDKKFLLGLARETLNSYLKDGKKPEVDEAKLSANLKKVQGCFVTLDSNGNLRGCIGHILPQEELYRCVIDNAVNAALRDSRFQPVSYDESKSLGVEISVLTVPEKLEFSSGEDLQAKLRPMVDGVVLKSGWHQSTYLPQVWDAFPDKPSFLSSLCVKGGANADCWKDTSTEVLTYQAEVFHESEFKD